MFSSRATLAPCQALAALYCLVSASPVFAALRQTPSASPSPDFAPTYLEAVPLRFADPKTIAQALTSNGLPEGIRSVTPDKTDKRALRVVGTQDGIAAVRQMVTLLDVAPPRISLAVHVSQVQFETGGKTRTTPLQSATLTTVHNKPVKLFSPGPTATGDTYELTVIPRLTGTTSPVTLVLRFGVRFGSSSSLGLERDTTIPPRTLRTVIGLTKNSDKSILSTVASGLRPTHWRAPFTAYYVEVRADPLPPTAPKKP